MRHAITACYVLAAVLAPRACCCAFRSTVAAKPHWTEAVAHTQVRAKGCPHCHHAADEKPATAPDGSQPAGAPGKSNCPCKEGRSHDAPAVVTATASQLLAGPDGPAAHPATHEFDRLPVPALAAAPGQTSGARSGPFLTEDDLLRAFHLLRC
jgi:hypothetical protein